MFTIIFLQIICTLCKYIFLLKIYKAVICIQRCTHNSARLNKNVKQKQLLFRNLYKYNV